jgi:hypothetical protein
MYTEAFVAGYYETLNKQAEHEPKINPGGAFAALRSSARRGTQALARAPKAVALVAGASLIGGGAAGYELAHKDHKHG